MYRSLIIGLGFMAAIVPVAAQNRPDSRSMTCNQVRELIAVNGAVVLTTGQFTYDRYVDSLPYCPSLTEPRAVAIETADTAQCTVFRCGEPLFPFDD